MKTLRLVLALLLFAFAINGFAQATCPPPPEQLSPADGSTISSLFVTLSWTPVPALRFDIFLGPAGTACSGNPASSDTSSFNPPQPLQPNTTYEWKVVAIRDVCPLAASPCRTFTTPGSLAQCPVEPSTLQTPPANAAVQPGPVTFSWSAVREAEMYELWISKDGATPVRAAATNTTSHTQMLAAGSYTWGVVALSPSCPPKESARREFTVVEPDRCPKQAPALVSPADGASAVASPVTFRWNPVQNASAYTLVVSVGGGAFENYGTTTNSSLERSVPVGSSVRWLVVATADKCEEIRSAVWTFETARPTCTDASVALRAPANGTTTTSPVKFEWSAVANAGAYRLWVSVAGSAPEIAARTTTATEATVSLGSGLVRWYVEALRGPCPPVVSTIGQFTIGSGATCSGNAAPTIVSPLGTQAAPVIVTDDDVTFRWNAVPNAIAYRVWVARAGQPFSDIATTKSTEVEREIEVGGRFTWFVQALFEGCAPTKSGMGYFQVPAAACSQTIPVLSSPAASLTVTSPVTISWSAVPGAGEYRVIAFLADGKTAVIGTTNEITLTRVLPPGNATVAIEAVFEECPSTFSARTSFSIAESQNCPTAPPQLIAPANGSAGVTVPIDLSWSSVPNAVRYVVMVSFTDGAATAAGETTTTQLTIRNLPAGRFEWWVLALVPGCKALESTHFRFSTPAPENCATAAPVGFEPRSGSALHGKNVDFDWSNVRGAKSYRVWIARGDDAPSNLANTTESEATLDLPAGMISWYVEAVFDGCPSTHSARGVFVATAAAPPCGTPAAPRANVIGQTISATTYAVRWTPLPNVDRYEVQESTTSDFSNSTTQTIDGISAEFVHSVESSTRYLYRVRGISNCSDVTGAFSNVVGVIVAPPRTTGTQRHATAEIGLQSSVVQTVFVPGAGAGATFSATVDKKWLKVQPASGPLPEAGATLNVLAEASVLAIGTSTGTVSVVVTTASSGRVSSNATSVNPMPISISLVTPVTPAGRSAPSPDSLIIPAVAHAEGQNNSLFESDIRLTNLGAQTAKYLINFTPSGVDGTKTGSTSTVEVAPNATVALDDILATLFGTGTASVVGMLEIRPLTSTSASTSYVTTSAGIQPLPAAASSRTYNVTEAGTFGQYIPAIPFSQFVGKGTKLSLQQIAQSSAFRTNFGFAEASGQAADLILRVFDTKNNLLKEIALSLLPSEHKQISSLLAVNGITTLQDGRVEVEVLSSIGKVTAYASTVDNATNDPLLVWPTVTSAVSASRYVLPGVALLNTGIADWRTDVRVFNGGAAPTPATLTFYPQFSPGTPVARSMTLNPGEVVVLDNVLQTFFGQSSPSNGGAIVVSTPAKTSVVATARTYNQTANGTYGQFIPGVTPEQSTGRGERSLQLLQLEQSSRIRTNVGLSETSGSSAKVEVSLILPDSKVSPVLQLDLAANEFRQIPLSAFGITESLYNVRAAVKVVDGLGRVTAYGSAIDMVTQDPTYVPAQ